MKKVPLGFFLWSLDMQNSWLRQNYPGVFLRNLKHGLYNVLINGILAGNVSKHGPKDWKAIWFDKNNQFEGKRDCKSRREAIAEIKIQTSPWRELLK